MNRLKLFEHSDLPAEESQYEIDVIGQSLLDGIGLTWRW